MKTGTAVEILMPLDGTEGLPKRFLGSMIITSVPEATVEGLVHGCAPISSVYWIG